MLSFDFYMPTAILCGENAVIKNASRLCLGRRALIVTGRSSAKLSGALDDVLKVLHAKAIGYDIFDHVTENPLLSTCHMGGALAVKKGSDFVIAIGGGSALDAGKAIAGYAGLHREKGGNMYAQRPMSIFDHPDTPCLPIVAIPTTAGTGSEVNPYSVLTLTDGETLPKKRTFKSSHSYPTLAILDERYTESLPVQVTVSTALDAFAHCVEAYFSPKSSEHSQQMALYGARTILRLMTETGDMLDPLTREQRRALLYASCAGGMAINRTGTGFPHPMGYNLTFAYGLPHGKACGVFMGAYLRAMAKTEEGRDRLSVLLSILAATPACCGATSDLAVPPMTAVTPDEDTAAMANVLAERIERMAGTDSEGNPLPKFNLTEEQITLFIEKTGAAGNFANAVSPITVEDQRRIYRAL